MVQQQQHKKDERTEQVLPNNIKMQSDAQIIYNNENYETRELEFADNTGRIVWSITLTKLKPGKQSRGHSINDLAEFFQIRTGTGWAIIKNQAYELKPNMLILNLPGDWIKIINTSSTDDLIYATYLCGFYRRPDVRKA